MHTANVTLQNTQIITSMIEETPKLTGERSQHIYQIAVDPMQNSDHREHDVVIRKLLRDPANQNLRHPQSRSDYFGLVKMIIEDYDLINDRKYSHFKAVETKYTGDNVNDEVFNDFKRMVDKCLAHGRFRDIRLLHEFYAHDSYYKDFETRLWWDYVVKYNVPSNYNVDWESDSELATHGQQPPTLRCGR